jgi:hypothetical protein
MKEGDILIYVGEDIHDLKRGDKFIFTRATYNPNRLLGGPYMVILQKVPTYEYVQYVVKNSEDFIDIKTFRDQRINKIVRG